MLGGGRALGYGLHCEIALQAERRADGVGLAENRHVLQLEAHGRLCPRAIVGIAGDEFPPDVLQPLVLGMELGELGGHGRGGCFGFLRQRPGQRRAQCCAQKRQQSGADAPCHQLSSGSSAAFSPA